MRVVILQPPAWLWETPGNSLAQALAVPHISFGDLVRAHVRQRTELGIRFMESMNSGELPPDELLAATVRDHLRREAPAGFLIDHHPLNTTQARALDELLHELSSPLDAVVHLHLPEQEVERHVRRQASRRVCSNDTAHPCEPAADHLAAERVCNVCGGDLYQRQDDQESTVRDRFSRHEAMVEPITRHYAEQELLVTVDAVGTPEEIAGRALTALRQHNRGHR
ncbi:adenylate kinase family protein [Streptomyces sp. H39-S7]|uniref:adenylate kinase family protein n=1 Tax=Streptomyces sp. H39-S7 TaxID=3004357 RepID=UPI0022B00571|nr:nucleoside monophosphate kinase [Streptomyces sp. H39-S7]MCZ4122807.1 nucleoside monophosphate kinase [Streptomyces sp. H39-S7]